MLEILRGRAGEPVTYVELQSAGIEFPGSVVSELELAGVQIDRCETTGPEGQTVRAVRLPGVPAADAAGRPVTEVGGEAGAPRDTAGPDWDEMRVYRGSLWLALETAWAEMRHRGGGAPLAGHARSLAPRRPTSRMLLPVAVVVALAATAAVVVAGLSGSDARQRSVTHERAGAATSAHALPTRSAPRRQTATSTTRARPSSPRISAAAGQQGSSSSLSEASHSVSSAGTGVPAQSTEYRADTPSGAVQAFYEAAAHHRYGSAWALADANMRNQLEGYARFADQMSSVRSITFHRAQMVGGSRAGVAKVNVQTTSVQSRRMRECGGSVRTVRSHTGWLLDGVSISCS